jgi:hypothetical protein
MLVMVKHILLERVLRSVSAAWLRYWLYSGVWFNTPGLAPAQIRQRLQKFGIKPDGIINFLSNEPPFKPGEAKDTARLAARRLILLGEVHAGKHTCFGLVSGFLIILKFIQILLDNISGS